jgi:hypothetical protein
MQLCHWSDCRLCSALIGHSAALLSAAAGGIAAGIAGGGGEEGLLGQAAALIVLSLVRLPPMQRCHWSHRRLCNAVIGHTAAY